MVTSFKIYETDCLRLSKSKTTQSLHRLRTVGDCPNKALNLQMNLNPTSPVVVSEFDDLCAHVCRSLPNKPTILVDGVTRAGKSTLAVKLADSLSIGLIKMDEYVIPDQGCYVEALDIDKLQRAMNGTDDCT